MSESASAPPRRGLGNPRSLQDGRELSSDRRGGPGPQFPNPVGHVGGAGGRVRGAAVTPLDRAGRDVGHQPPQRLDIGVAEHEPQCRPPVRSAHPVDPRGRRPGGRPGTRRRAPACWSAGAWGGDVQSSGVPRLGSGRRGAARRTGSPGRRSHPLDGEVLAPARTDPHGQPADRPRLGRGRPRHGLGGSRCRARPQRAMGSGSPTRPPGAARPPRASRRPPLTARPTGSSPRTSAPPPPASPPTRPLPPLPPPPPPHASTAMWVTPLGTAWLPGVAKACPPGGADPPAEGSA